MSFLTSSPSLGDIINDAMTQLTGRYMPFVDCSSIWHVQMIVATGGPCYSLVSALTSLLCLLAFHACLCPSLIFPHLHPLCSPSMSLLHVSHNAISQALLLLLLLLVLLLLLLLLHSAYNYYYYIIMSCGQCSRFSCVHCRALDACPCLSLVCLVPYYYYYIMPTTTTTTT